MELNLSELLKKVAPRNGVKYATKPLGLLTKGNLVKHLTEHMKASGVHPHLLKHLRQSKVFDGLWDKIKGTTSKLPAVSPVLGGAMSAGRKRRAPKAVKAVKLVRAVASGRPRKERQVRKLTPARQAHIAKMKKRGMEIKALMTSKGWSLAQASKHLAQQKK